MVAVASVDGATVTEAWDEGFSGIPTYVDVVHSDLLLWLLLGREPTPQPPPVLWGHLSHRLATGEPVKVSVSSDEKGWEKGRRVTIC